MANKTKAKPRKTETVTLPLDVVTSRYLRQVAELSGQPPCVVASVLLAICVLREVHAIGQGRRGHAHRRTRA